MPNAVDCGDYGAAVASTRRLGWLGLWAVAAACGGAVDASPLLAQSSDSPTEASSAALPCRVIDRIMVKAEEIAQLLETSSPDLGLRDAVVYQTGDALSVVPRSAESDHGFLRVAAGGRIFGTSFPQTFAEAFTVAGDGLAAQLIGLGVGNPGAWAAVLEPTTRSWRERRPIVDDVLLSGQTRQLRAAPSLDGLRSTFAVGNRVLGPIDVGVIDADAQRVGNPTRVCAERADCTCVSVVPTQTAGAVSVVERLSERGSESWRWRLVELDATGRVLRDASAPIGARDCPKVTRSKVGFTALVSGADGPSLLHLEHPERPTRLVSPGSALRPLLGLAASGPDVLLLEHGEPPTVVRARAGVIDEASRLTLPGTARDAQVVSTGGDDMLIYYSTDTAREFVRIACR